MKINVIIMGTLTRPTGKDRFVHQCEDGTTVLQFLKSIKYDPNHIPHIITSINNEIKRHNTVLNEGDELLLTIPVGGG